MNWGVVITAGGSAPKELVAVTGQSRKALTEFGGKPSLRYVIEAAKESSVKEIVVVSGEEVRPYCADAHFQHERGSAIENAAIGAESIDNVTAILFLPADAPLIKSESLIEFMRLVDARVQNEQDWFAAGLTPTEWYESEFPGAPFKSIRLKEGKFLAGALYAASPNGVRLAIDNLQSVRHSRKNQIAMLLKLGIINVLRYACGKVNIERAEKIVGKFLGAPAFIDSQCAAATCMDFDDVADFEYLVNHFDKSRSTK